MSITMIMIMSMKINLATWHLNLTPNTILSTRNT